MKTFYLTKKKYNGWVLQVYWPTLMVRKTEFLINMETIIRISPFDRKPGVAFVLLGLGVGVGKFVT